MKRLLVLAASVAAAMVGLSEAWYHPPCISSQEPFIETVVYAEFGDTKAAMLKVDEDGSEYMRFLGGEYESIEEVLNKGDITLDQYQTLKTVGRLAWLDLNVSDLTNDLDKAIYDVRQTSGGEGKTYEFFRIGDWHKANRYKTDEESSVATKIVVPTVNVKRVTPSSGAAYYQFEVNGVKSGDVWQVSAAYDGKSVASNDVGAAEISGWKLSDPCSSRLSSILTGEDHDLLNHQIVTRCGKNGDLHYLRIGAISNLSSSVAVDGRSVSSNGEGKVEIHGFADYAQTMVEGDRLFPYAEKLGDEAAVLWGAFGNGVEMADDTLGIEGVTNAAAAFAEDGKTRFASVDSTKFVWRDAMDLFKDTVFKFVGGEGEDAGKITLCGLTGSNRVMIVGGDDHINTVPFDNETIKVTDTVHIRDIDCVSASGLYAWTDAHTWAPIVFPAIPTNGVFAADGASLSTNRNGYACIEGWNTDPAADTTIGRLITDAATSDRDKFTILARLEFDESATPILQYLPLGDVIPQYAGYGDIAVGDREVAAGETNLCVYLAEYNTEAYALPPYMVGVDADGEFFSADFLKSYMYCYTNSAPIIHGLLRVAYSNGVTAAVSRWDPERGDNSPIKSVVLGLDDKTVGILDCADTNNAAHAYVLREGDTMSGTLAIGGEVPQGLAAGLYLGGQSAPGGIVADAVDIEMRGADGTAVGLYGTTTNGFSAGVKIGSKFLALDANERLAIGSAGSLDGCTLAVDGSGEFVGYLNCAWGVYIDGDVSGTISLLTDSNAGNLYIQHGTEQTFDSDDIVMTRGATTNEVHAILDSGVHLKMVGGAVHVFNGATDLGYITPTAP